jgi:hypothetical protein
MFVCRVEPDFVDLKVLQELKNRYEAGNWTVGIIPVVDGGQVTTVQLAFAPTGQLQHLSRPRQRTSLSLPPLDVLLQQNTIRPIRRLLMRMPTRSRPAQAIAVLEQYRRLSGCAFQIEVILDEDDQESLASEILQRFAALDCIVTVGPPTSKVGACNSGKVTEWDVLMLASDDMVPVAEDWAVRVLQGMQQHWPHLDGAIFFNDGYQRDHLCTLPIFGKRFYDQFGYIYAPDYKSLFCDREQTDLLKSMGRLAYVDEKLIEHRHHVWGRADKDALYERNDSLETEDKATYERRKQLIRPHAQFAFDMPPLWLSILICTVPKRKTQLEWLLGYLWSQIYAHRSPLEAEILVDDREELTVGEKRQALLERAKGHYIAFIDDDDAVAHDYVARLVGALSGDPEADCASLVGVMTTNGAKPEIFKHSISYDGWYTRAGVHYRTPNHLSAVRRTLALEVGFISKDVGEDHDYSKRLRPLLKRETSTGEAPLYFYFYNPKQSVQSQRRQG